MLIVRKEKKKVHSYIIYNINFLTQQYINYKYT